MSDESDDPIARARKLAEAATPDRLDEIAAHDCGVSHVALAALQALGDVLRALDEARCPSITRADARELLEMSDTTTSEACYERVRAALREYAGGDFECHQPNPLDVAKRQAAIECAAKHEFRERAETSERSDLINRESARLLGRLVNERTTERDALRVELAESKRLRDEALTTFRAREDAIEKAEKRALTAEMERASLLAENARLREERDEARKASLHPDTGAPLLAHYLSAMTTLDSLLAENARLQAEIAQHLAFRAEVNDALPRPFGMTVHGAIKALREERDARPAITREDAGAAWGAYTLRQEESNAAFHRVGDALRAHASQPKAKTKNELNAWLRDAQPEPTTILVCSEQPKGDVHAGRELLAWGETLSDETKATLLEQVDPLHPDGKCQCAGEGLCEWCVRVGICDSDITRRAATDREIVRVVRLVFGHVSDEKLLAELRDVMDVKEGEGTR